MDCIPKPRKFRGQGRRRKASVKITVSADLPYGTVPDVGPPPHEVLKKIIIGEKDKSGGGRTGDNEDGTITRVTVDDSIVDFPNCIDFGIQDFLCCKDEIDLELSSDNDMSYLEATPPHRFSDSEFEGQIEIMSITLDNVLKLGPKRTGSWNRSMSRDDIFTVDLHVEEVSDDNQNNDDEDQPETITSSSENEETVQLHAHDKTFTSSETETIMNERVGEVVRPLLSINGSRRLPPPPRPFRRHISLPASIFMNYLLAAEKNLTKNGVESGGNKKYPHQQQRVNRKKEGLNNRNNDSRCSSRRLLTKIDGSCSSSTESAEEQDNDFEDISHPDQDGVVVMTSGESASFDDSSSATNTPIYLNSSELDLAENRKEALSVEEGLDRDSPAFTSEIEKRSILLRYMRRLIRQDTSANFAPNDYCI